MLIILEGPDGSGKTHLARDLEDLIQHAQPNDTIEIRHSNAPHPDEHPLDVYERTLTSYRPGEGRHLILDRWHWGEYVYPSVLGRPTKLNLNQLWHIENYLARLGAVVVQTTQYDDQYHRIYRERGETLEPRILSQVISRYRDMRRMSFLPVVDWNWMSPMHGDLHNVVAEADRHERSCIELAQFTTYVGPRRPDFLLLGDERGPQHMVSDPAFVPFSWTSGDFLLGSVLHNNIGPRDDNLRSIRDTFKFGLANACDVDDVYKLWLCLGQPCMVALGRNAMKKLSTIQRVGFNPNHSWGAVPHPQYVRRFHHGDRLMYGQNIRMAARHGGDYSKWHEFSKAEPDKPFIVMSSTSSDARVAAGSRATDPPSNSRT